MCSVGFTRAASSAVRFEMRCLSSRHRMIWHQVVSYYSVSTPEAGTSSRESVLQPTQNQTRRFRTLSEYQYVEFRAVDRPLTDAGLAFAEKQSTRAEISRWAFRNEYHYSDFRGDVNGLLRRGYDVHLHYANFGVRTAAFRLPAGLPFPKAVWSLYIGIGELAWTPDRKGQGGILSLSPFHDAGGIDEIWNLGEYMEDLVEVRSRLVAGDLSARCMSSGSVQPSTINPSSQMSPSHRCRVAWRTARMPSGRSSNSSASIPSFLRPPRKDHRAVRNARLQKNSAASGWSSKVMRKLSTCCAGS